MIAATALVLVVAVLPVAAKNDNDRSIQHAVRADFNHQSIDGNVVGTRSAWHSPQSDFGGGVAPADPHMHICPGASTPATTESSVTTSTTSSIEVDEPCLCRGRGTLRLRGTSGSRREGRDVGFDTVCTTTARPLRRTALRCIAWGRTRPGTAHTARGCNNSLRARGNPGSVLSQKQLSRRSPT